MAGGGSQDKGEKPTPRRREKARQQGKVAKSQDIGNVAVLLAGLGGLYMFGGHFYSQITGVMRHMLSNAAQTSLGELGVHNLSVTLMDVFWVTVLPMFLVVAVAAVLANLAQVGFMFVPTKLKPSLSNFNLTKGFKKFVSMKAVVDLFKNVGKLLLVGWVVYQTLKVEWTRLPGLEDMSIYDILTYVLDVAFTIFLRCVLALTVLAILDWCYQKYDYEKGLKMSKQEVKDEYKQSEGDPQVKSRIRTLQRDQARHRMMSDVPQADVVVTNPTHLAVALSYRMGEMDAPEVVAKGANRVAEKIKEIAREHNIPIIEDKPLAQALYKLVEVGQQIPADLFEAVASILAHVFRLKNRHHQFLNSGAQGR